MDNYQRVRVLGRGAFATVVLAQLGEKDGGPLHVIKEVDLAQANEKARAGALLEAELLKSLCHPNIIAYHDAHLANARLCIVMEYADGGDLAAAVARRKAAARRHHEREAMAVFGQLAMALDYIHQRLILHRDLKSKNVFLTRAGMVKLGDFGIAKVLDAADSMAETRIGTPYYLPPEMCTNKPYDFRADIWCLGVVLYELLALEVPFNAPNIPALATKICSTEPRPVPQVYSSDLRALLAHLMAKKAEDRPSAADIVALPHVRRGIAMMLGHGNKIECGRLPQSEGGCISPSPEGADAAFHPGDNGKLARLDLPLLDDQLPLVDLLAASRCCSPADGENILQDDRIAEPDYMTNSLKQALESSMACEALLRELEQEFDLA